MTSVNNALNIILDTAYDIGTEKIALNESMGRVLREPIYADRDFPPFDRVSMDGIAIRYQDFQNGQRTFKVVGIAAAGSPQTQLSQANTCLEIMTGAIMAEGADTVIPYERINIENGIAQVETQDVRANQNVHAQGFDRKQGDILIETGKRLSTAEIGVCATVGKSHVAVSRSPKTMVISSGDELVKIHEQPLAHQIRKSNVHQIAGVLREVGINAHMTHLEDEYATILEKLSSYLEEYELIILSGGVSKGKFDFLPQALEELGVQKHFHRVEQRPGKPFWFGTKNKTAVFAFPGNPVSSFVSLQIYLKAWIEKSMGIVATPTVFAQLTEAVDFRPKLTYFLQVKIQYGSDGRILATPVKGNGSGDLANLVNADAFLMLPADKEHFEPGEAYPLLQYR